jgi:hypothetical protein
MNEAILVMDSRSAPEALRSQNVTAAWSRVYRLEDYYIDLNLKATSHTAVLMGQILPVTKHLRGSAIDIKASGGKLLENVPVGGAGDFRCTLAYPGVYRLEIRLADRVLELPLEV